MSIDTVALKASIDLLALIGADTRLRKVAGTNGGEWAGSCPFCGGRDRLRVQPLHGLWWCRQCGGDHWQDAVAYVMKRDGVDFREACERLGANLTTRQPLAPLVPLPPAEQTQEPPSWAEAGLQAVAECEAALWSEAGARARHWLAARGLAEATMREWRLGFNPAEGERSGLFLRRGIVIPGIGVDGRLWYLKVRQPVGAPKYIQAKGSRPALLGRLTGKPALLLTEGEFDAMLAWQEAGELVDVATFGSVGGWPGHTWTPYLLPYARLLVAFDVDEAGEKGAARWSAVRRAKRLRLPLAEGEGKDLTDLVLAGGDLRLFLSLAVGESGNQELGDVCACGGELYGYSPTGAPLCERCYQKRRDE